GSPPPLRPARLAGGRTLVTVCDGAVRGRGGCVEYGLPIARVGGGLLVGHGKGSDVRTSFALVEDEGVSCQAVDRRIQEAVVKPAAHLERVPDDHAAPIKDLPLWKVRTAEVAPARRLGRHTCAGGFFRPEQGDRDLPIAPAARRPLGSGD